MAGKQPKSRFYEFADFRVDSEKRMLTQADRPISLTPKVFEMLVILLERRGEVVPKKLLMDLLWPDSFVEESNLTQNVAVLRKALGDSSKQPEFILTVPGQGYRFVGDTTELGSQNGNEAAMMSPEADVRAVAKERRRWPIVGASVLLVAVSVAAIWYAYDRFGRPSLPSVQRTAQVTSWTGLDFYPSISPDGTTIAYSSDRTGAFEIFVKQLLQPTAREVQLTSDGGQNFQPEISPDASMIVYHSKSKGGIWVMPISGGTAKQVSNFGSAPAWSPDGTRIAFQSDPLNDLGSNVRNAMPPSTIWIVSVRDGGPTQVTQPGTPPGGHGAPSWSPDGKTLVFDTNDWNSSALATVNLASGETKMIETPGHSAADPIFTPDGGSVVFVADIGLSIQSIRISASGTAAGEPVKLLDSSGNRVRQPSIDARGQRVVYSSLSGSSSIWSSKILPDGPSAPEALTKTAAARTSLPFYSPDGSKIVYQAYTIGAISHLWTMNSDGSDHKQISSRPGFSSSWSKDGARIFFVTTVETEPGSRTLERTSLWSVSADAAVERKLLDFDEVIYNVRVSPDEKRAVIASKRSGSMNLWMMALEDGAELKQITSDPEFAGFPAWSPDGNWIAFQLKRKDNTYVAVMPSNGGEAVQLNTDNGQSWVYDWSPNSEEIVFAGQRNGIWNIYSVSRVTKQQRQLTNFSKLNSFVRYPAWSPSGDRVAYEYSESTGNVWSADLK